MYNLPRDLALKKKKQAVRRLSQSGAQGNAKPVISPIFAGKKVPAPPRGGTLGGRPNAGVEGKNPFQLSATSASNQQPANPFQSAQQSSNTQLPTTQTGSLFKPSSNEFSASSNPFVAPSFSQPTGTTNASISIGTKSYAQALKTEETKQDEPASKPVFGPRSGAQNIRPHGNMMGNPFAKASNAKFQSSKVPSKANIWGPPVRAQRSVPPVMDQYVVMLSVRNVDEQLCKPEVLQSHFQQFGGVVELKCMPRKRMATVAYNDYKAALRAKQQGTVIDTNYSPLHISLQKRRPSSSQQSSERKSIIPSQYVWEPAKEGLSSQKEAVNATDQPAEKSSVFSRLGSPPVKGGTANDRKGSPLKAPKRKSPVHSFQQHQEEDVYVPSQEDWEQEGDDMSEDKVVSDRLEPTTTNRLATTGNETVDDSMDTVARHVGHSYDLRSLHRGTGGGDINSTAGVVPVSLVTATSTTSKPVVMTSLPSQLSSLSAAQIYEILDNRDSQLRKTMVKQTTLATAVAIVGACPDMCPEKERYRRESIKRLSMFEMLSSCDPQNPQVDHAKAVKEYSGSAADKDEPLPHELRPPHVLQMTMDYLVTMVINHNLAGSSEWFNFIWNRTRAVRKDITLQHLCSSAMAEIVEKCARFHVLCAHLMCEEDISAFDPSMNNENLSKCLQTLKEFYRDLRKKGIECHNEAEFCCYDILLHLNEGDVLSKVDDYTLGISSHPLVHFAIQVALAWDSNNFVRFFKLVRSTTYLNSCLLHRYFNQIRAMALGLLSRTHTAAGRVSQFAAADMQRMLSMETEEKVVTFCGYHGIEVEENGSRLLLSREAFIAPNKPFEVFRSPELVEGKNFKTFGEVIQGGPLPPVPHHVPVSSLGNNAAMPQQLPSYRAPVPARVVYEENDILGTVEVMLSATVPKEVNAIVRDAVLEMQQLYAACDLVKMELINNVIASVCRGLSEQTMAEEKERIRKLREERERLVEITADKYVTQLVGEIAVSEAANIANTTLREEHTAAEILRNAANHVMMEMSDVVVAMAIQSIAEESIKEAVLQRKQHLNSICSHVMKMRMGRFFGRWRRSTLRCQQVKKCLETFPPSAPLQPLSYLLEQLQPSGKKPRLDIPTDPLSLLQNRRTTFTDVRTGYSRMAGKRNQFWEPIPVPSLVSRELASRLQFPLTAEAIHSSTAHYHWQLVLMLPPTTGESVSYAQWLRSMLSVAPPSVPTCKTPVELLSLSNNQQIQVIVKLFQGFSSLQVQEKCASCLKGTSAILTYIPNSIKVNDLLEKLNSLVGHLKPQPQIPLLVLCRGDTLPTDLAATEETICASFPVISTVKFVPFSHSIDFSQYLYHHQQKEELCEAIRWLALHSCILPQFIWQPLYDYMEKGLLELFVQPVMLDHKLRMTLGATSQPCQGIVALYDSAVEHLAALASSDSLVQFSWPCEETSSTSFSFQGAPPLHWNNPQHLARLNELILSLKIPSPQEEELTGDNCLAYVQMLCEAHQIPEHLQLLTNVQSLFHPSNKKHASWVHVITMCMSHVLKSIGPDQWVCMCHSGDRSVKISAFKEPSEWMTCVASTMLARVQHNHTPLNIRVKAHQRHWTEPFSKPITVNPIYHSPHAKTNQSMRETLYSRLQQEQLDSKEFDDLLLQCVNSPSTVTQ